MRSGQVRSGHCIGQLPVEHAQRPGDIGVAPVHPAEERAADLGFLCAIGVQGQLRQAAEEGAGQQQRDTRPGTQHARTLWSVAV